MTDQKKIRHCMIVYALYPYAETRVQREAEGLLASGIEVDVICPRSDPEPPFEIHNGVTIHRVKMKWARKKGLLRQIWQYIKFITLVALKVTGLHFRNHYNVIQAHNLPDFLVFSALIPKIFGARVILDIHDLSPEFYQSWFRKSPRHILVRLVVLQERLSCMFADHVITVSEIWREKLIKRGVRPEKCTSVMNLADTRIFKPQSREGIENNRFNLFYHGDLSDRYDLDMVIKSAAELRQRCPQLRVVLVGNGRNDKYLKSLTADLGLDESVVKFIDMVPAEELLPLFPLADVGIVPLRNDAHASLALATKLMEYAVMGLPTIVSRTVGHAYYFDDSMVQFYTPCDYEDLKRNIVAIYEDPQRRQAIAKGILAFNVRHNWKDECAKYVACVKKLHRH